MATLSNIATVYAVRVLARLEGRFFQYNGMPSVFSGGGFSSALERFDCPASATCWPQMAVLASLVLLVVAMAGGSGMGEFAGARRALGF